MLTFIISAVICYILGKVVVRFGAKKGWTSTRRFITSMVCCCALTFLAFNLSSCSSTSCDKDGYAYVVDRLKSPTTAQLLSVVNKDKFRNFIKQECNINLPDGLEAECYEISAQNGFGAHLKSRYIVFFWHGKPIHMEEGLECVESPYKFSFVKQAIKINTGIDVD